MKPTQTDIAEIDRVLDEAHAIGCQYLKGQRDRNGLTGHEVRAFRGGKIHRVHISVGQSVKSAVDMHFESVDLLAEDAPLTSIGPGGIGHEYSAETTADDYKPLFKNHKRVGLVARLLGYFKKG
jgi:hypothetical protein